MSRFSNRYLTSEISKQPALLNSVTRLQFQKDGKAKKRSHLSPASKQRHPLPQHVAGSVGVTWMFVIELNSHRVVQTPMHPLKKNRSCTQIGGYIEKGNRREQERPNSTTCGEAQQTTLESREGTNEHNTGKATIENHSTIP